MHFNDIRMQTSGKAMDYLFHHHGQEQALTKLCICAVCTSMNCPIYDVDCRYIVTVIMSMLMVGH